MPAPDAILDRDVFTLQTAGDAALARDVLHLFRDQARRTIPMLGAADERRQTELAHLLRGSCLGIGATRCAELLNRYEDAAPGERRNIAPGLQDAFAALDEAIGALLDSL